MSVGLYCPASVNCTTLLPFLLILGNVLVFLLLGLEYRLLKPRRLTPLFWISPLLYGYILITVVAGIILLEYGSSVWNTLFVVESFAALLVAGLLGVGAGRVIGKRVKIGVHPDGKRWFQGGTALVALLWACLLPTAIVSAVNLVGVASTPFVSTLIGSPPFLLFDLVSGALFFFVAALSITWKSGVTARFVELHHGHRSAR